MLRSSLVFFFLFSVTPIVSMPRQIIIIRHGEKAPNGQLSSKGFRRAQALGPYFTSIDHNSTNPPLFTNGLPTAIVAAKPIGVGSNNTIRCIDTIMPTAVILQLPIHNIHGLDAPSVVANYVLTESLFDDQNVIICWHHPEIAALIAAFGYLPPSTIYPVYPEDRYDLVWLLEMPPPVPSVTVDPILQELLYGDASSFP